jgi:hypothetical protein
VVVPSKAANAAERVVTGVETSLSKALGKLSAGRGGETLIDQIILWQLTCEWNYFRK